MQEFLASFGVQIDESGLNRLQQALWDNRQLAEDLSAAFDHARSEIDTFFHDLSVVEHQYSVAELLDKRDIMANEQYRQPEFFPQACE